MLLLWLQVAQHLSKTYGDRAVKVARLAQLTGKRWPIVGRRLHEDYPYIEAEVSTPYRYVLICCSALQVCSFGGMR